MMKKLFLLMFFFGIVSSSAFAQNEPEAEDLTDYKIACLAAIDNISKIGNGINLDMWETLAFNTAVAGAKAGLDECETSDAMQGVMTGLRALVMALMQTKTSFSDNLTFTGLIGNHSFDTGDLSSWSTIGFDLDRVDINQVTNDIITKGDVSGLIDAIIVNEWKDDTKAVENTGENAMNGGHNKYYLNSDNQLLMAPLIGLPAGVYSFSAKVATPGFGQTNIFLPNNVFLNALVISSDVVQEFLNYELPTNPESGIDFATIFSTISLFDIIMGRVDFEKLATEKLPELLGLESVSGWTDLLSNSSKIWENIEPLLKYGRLYSGSMVGTGLTGFSNLEMKFMVDEGDLVLIGINAGLTQFIGTEHYRADNLRLTGLRSVGSILSSVRADLNAALDGLTAVEANNNADAKPGTVQPAFSYDKTLSEEYNNAYYIVKNQQVKRLRDIVTQEDLEDLDIVDQKLDQYKKKVAADINAFKVTKEAFDKNAFIAPATNEQFNILMNATTPEWSGNAVTIDKDMIMSFSQKPGKSAFTLAFSFERASEEYTNKLYAFVDDGENKYYLAERDGSLFLTTDLSAAVVITAVPSFTTQGETSLKEILREGEKYLGTTPESNVFVPTDGEGQLTELAVMPAAEMLVSITIPTGSDVCTLMLPFDAALTYIGLSACTITGVATDLPYVNTQNVTSFKANTPYCVMANPGKYSFSGVSRAIKTSYGNDLFIGRHTPYTTRGGNEYKMMVDSDGFGVFNRANGLSIAANECYLRCNDPSGVIFFRRADAVTGIKEMMNEESRMENKEAVYDLSGRKVVNSKSNSHLPKSIYIQGGKKILY